MEEDVNTRHLTAQTYIEITTTEEFIHQRWKQNGRCLKEVKEGNYRAMDWFPQQDSFVPIEIYRVCKICPVRLECLSWAIYANEDKGIWGGQSIKRVRKMRRMLRDALRSNFPRAVRQGQAGWW